ncbi:MAG: site-2 protease family protein [Candidatus ainarchaeum sp.]|nr:site-2 protease family protein [Candidatus ainarchaeum sp.]
MYFVVFLVIMSFLLLYFIAASDLGALQKFGLAVIELIITGMILRKSLKASKNFWIDGEWGLLLLKTKKGLDKIDKLAEKSKFWETLADIGTIVGYGVFSYFIMRKHFTWKKFVAGMIIITILTMFLVPYAIPFLISNLKGQAVSTDVQETSFSIINFLIGIVITYGFGLFGVIFSGVAQYGMIIIGKLVSVLLGTGTLGSESAGATLIIPGINIPLIEGIIALLVILVVHEGAHAILGRVAKVPMHSTGLVLLGTVPIGAFVEPDEQWLSKLEKKKQTRVLIAGPTANFMFAIIFFSLFLSFGYVFDGYKEKGLLILDGLEKGTIVYSVNGVNISDIGNLNPGEKVYLQTNNGEIEKVVNENGKIGISYYVLDSTYIVRYKEHWMDFIYVTLGLIFSLNFVIGVINLLPIPSFDGHRLIELNIKNKEIVRFITYVSVIGLLMNFVPWLF